VGNSESGKFLAFNSAYEGRILVRSLHLYGSEIRKGLANVRADTYGKETPPGELMISILLFLGSSPSSGACQGISNRKGKQESRSLLTIVPAIQEIELAVYASPCLRFPYLDICQSFWSLHSTKHKLRHHTYTRDFSIPDINGKHRT
jgi:hypothetical protein